MDDETILAGFSNLHQVIVTGFRDMRAEFGRVWTAIDELRAEMHSEFAAVRSEMAGLEARVMRRFDRVDERLDSPERRLGALEARVDSLAQA